MDPRVLRTAPLLPAAALLVVAVLVALLVSCVTPAAARHTTPIVTIPKGQGVFAPYILPVAPRTRITWRNQDSAAHTVTTTPDHSGYLNPAALSLTVPAGGSATLTLSQPGIYDYYDTGSAQWNAEDHHVSANAGSPAYPLAMEGIIWVQGPIKGLTSSVTNPIPGKDLFASEFLAVPQGGSVFWYDADTDGHTVTQVAGWQAPINPSSFSSLALAGSDGAPPNGETRMLTFETPGLYYYYCAAHATISQRWHRVAPLRMASEYPVPMEGFILVVGP
jgi:plastocyanin